MRKDLDYEDKAYKSHFQIIIGLKKFGSTQGVMMELLK